MEWAIDHFVLVASRLEETLHFYERGFQAEIRDLAEWCAGRVPYPMLFVGPWKINLHPIETDATPVAANPAPGSLDLCFVWPGPITEAVHYLTERGVAIELGPVPQAGAAGRGKSVYFRDPEGNLLEFLSYQ